MNVGLGLFNLIPIPPLDGSRILNLILPTRLYFKVMRYERKIYFGLLIWLLIGDYVSRFLLSISFVSQIPLLSFLAGLFSLTGTLGSIFTAVSDGMMWIWRLIPFLNN
jgi:Zn-dependent protease